MELKVYVYFTISNLLKVSIKNHLEKKNETLKKELSKSKGFYIDKC